MKISILKVGTRYLVELHGDTKEEAHEAYATRIDIKDVPKDEIDTYVGDTSAFGKEGTGKKILLGKGASDDKEPKEEKVAETNA